MRKLFNPQVKGWIESDLIDKIVENEASLPEDNSDPFPFDPSGPYSATFKPLIDFNGNQVGVERVTVHRPGKPDRVFDSEKEYLQWKGETVA